MRILGLATMGASAAAIVEDGHVVAAIEEERLTRLKNDGGFPHRAIDCVLQSAGVTLSDIDAVAVYWQPWRIWGRAAAVAGDMLLHRPPRIPWHERLPDFRLGSWPLLEL